ncbi:MAG: XTP/dITP diphosphatase [Lachnospiraceae bacterium]|nr:XTP/dITP diphosphatase [Lachnospiraceae bacterium]
MPGRIVFATGNKGKLKEVEMILKDLGRQVVSMKEAGVETEIVEDGTTFAENAMIKARAVHAVCGGLVLADDSGLEIDCLNKEPGVYSARYLGEDTPYEIKNGIILQRLEGVAKEERSARFVCVIGAVLPDGRELLASASVEGSVAFHAAGEGGFGYDPIFFVDEFGKTMAELTPEEKNQISHRGKALREMKELLRKQAL